MFFVKYPVKPMVTLISTTRLEAILSHLKTLKRMERSRRPPRLLEGEDAAALRTPVKAIKRSAQNVKAAECETGIRVENRCESDRSDATRVRRVKERARVGAIRFKRDLKVESQ